jgi:putative ABC transport system permease protein
MGKTLLVGGTRNYVVSGVAQDAPANSQIKFDFVASYASLPNASNPNWGVEVYATYFLLRPGTDPVSLEKKMGVFMRNLPELADLGNDYLIYHLEPITRVHLYSRLGGLEPSGNIQYIYILAIVAILILIIAGVNYTNLTTAQAVGRIPEISIRKVLGSRRIQLFWQFMGESLLLNLLAMAIAIILVVALLPAFDRLVERPIEAGMILQQAGIALLLVLYAGISFMAGIYPALVLSGLKLIRMLKAGFSFSTGTGPLRKSLIVFQFFASIFLIVSTVVIYEQMQYIRKKDLGYDQSHVVALPVDLAMRPNFRAIKESLARLPGVLSVSCGAEEPTYIRWDDAVTLLPGPSSKPVLTYASPADPDFVRTLGLHIIAGTDFTQADWMQMNGPDNPDPQTSFMLNETLTRAMGWKPQEALGKIMYRSDHKGVVKAVVKDFNFAPLHTSVAPLVIFLDSQYYHIYQAFVKISGNNIPSTLSSMEATWKERVTHRPFEYHFLDDNFHSIYHTEEQTAQIFTVFSALAIVLACMGLFALAAYTTVQRAKEIGIRKVLGAGEWRLVMLVSGDFLKLVGISTVLAFPVAWYFLHRWLENFAYRIQISWVIFLVAGGAAVALAFVSIFAQAYRAAIANPVRSLRTE